jgi:hypothetical protein
VLSLHWRERFDQAEGDDRDGDHSDAAAPGPAANEAIGDARAREDDLEHAALPS